MALEDRMNSESVSWRPDKEDGHPNPLIGEVVDVETGESTYGEYPVLTIADAEGNEWRWSVLGGVAQKRIGQLNPQVGDRIGARYLGTKPSPNYPGKVYSDWKIVLERGNRAPAPAAPEPAPRPALGALRPGDAAKAELDAKREAQKERVDEEAFFGDGEF